MHLSSVWSFVGICDDLVSLRLMTTTSGTMATSAALTAIQHEAPVYSSYKPLNAEQDEIRLLNVREGLQCTLRHVNLQDQPPYCALSYYWGAPGITKPIWINGEEVQVRKTLYKFLKSLLHQFGPLTVWLDVICINQRNLTEQSAQVTMMGDIYKLATCVYAWLGAGDADTDYAFSHLSQHPLDLTELSDIDSSRIKSGVRQLLLRPYMTRVWILQECVVNADLYFVCGLYTILEAAMTAASEHWACDIFPLLTALTENRTYSHSPMSPRAGSAQSEEVFDQAAWQRYSQIREAREEFRKSGTILLELVHTFARYSCTDVRDKIYGLRALAIDGTHLVVDYNSSLVDIIFDAIAMHNQESFRRWCDPVARSPGASGAQLKNDCYNWCATAPWAPGEDSYCRDGTNKNSDESRVSELTVTARDYKLGLDIISGSHVLCKRLGIRHHHFRPNALCMQDKWMIVPVFPQALDLGPNSLCGNLLNVSSNHFHTRTWAEYLIRHRFHIGLDCWKLVPERTERHCNALLCFDLRRGEVNEICDLTLLTSAFPGMDSVVGPLAWQEQLLDGATLHALFPGHLWVCSHTRSMHISRYVFAMLVDMAMNGWRDCVNLLADYAKHALSPSTIREQGQCGCESGGMDSQVLNTQRPWSAYHEDHNRCTYGPWRNFRSDSTS